jgi:hypothetical protein
MEHQLRPEPSPTKLVAVTIPLAFILVADKNPTVDIPVSIYINIHLEYLIDFLMEMMHHKLVQQDHFHLNL